MASGTSRLARVLTERIKAQTQRPDMLELGVIQGDLSLKLDRFAVPLPEGSYLVAWWLVKLSLPAFDIQGALYNESQNQLLDSGGGKVVGQTIFHMQPVVIDQSKIEPLPDLKPGDRVLVAWVNDYTDPVVLCKVVSS